jgi:hypothetical protein
MITPMAVKRKNKMAPTSSTQAVLVHFDKSTMGRLKKFQSKFEREYGMKLKNAPAVKMLTIKGLNVFEMSGEQLDLIDAIAAKPKRK